MNLAPHKNPYHWSSIFSLPGLAALAKKGPADILLDSIMGSNSARWALFFGHCGLIAGSNDTHTFTEATLNELFFGSDHTQVIIGLWLHSNGQPEKISIANSPDDGHVRERFFNEAGTLIEDRFFYDTYLSNPLGPAVVTRDSNGVITEEVYWVDGDPIEADVFKESVALRVALHEAVSQIVTSPGAVNI